jgi:hypothetical protein
MRKRAVLRFAAVLALFGAVFIFLAVRFGGAAMVEERQSSGPTYECQYVAVAQKPAADGHPHWKWRACTTRKAL